MTMRSHRISLDALFAVAACVLLVCCTSSKTAQITTMSGDAKAPEAAQQQAPATPADSKDATPRLRFSPSVLVTTPDSLGYVTAKVYIRNDGGGTLIMTDIKGSCGCAGASVQRNRITTLDSGMIYLQINTKSFTEVTNNVDFTVKSNADNSPTVFRTVINIRK